jgi:hypothetical protein
MAGQEAYVGPWATNPDWVTPTSEPLEGDWTAVYPEIVQGNPWNAPHVVRWVLNDPGKLGGDRVYDPSEQVFAFLELFMDVPPERALRLPVVETDIYTDRHLLREGTVFYVGKGHKTRELPGAVEVTREMAADREAFAELLNRAALMVCFDDITAMIDVARLCGCPVQLIQDSYTWEQYDRSSIGWEGLGWDEVPTIDSAAFRAHYLGLMDTFHERLADFIRVTSGELVAA